jgi:hypothetical protein
MLILLILALFQGLAFATNCSNFALPFVPGATVLSIQSNLAYNISSPLR